MTSSISAGVGAEVGAGQQTHLGKLIAGHYGIPITLSHVMRHGMRMIKMIGSAHSSGPWPMR
jgi:hypothetical protein